MQVVKEVPWKDRLTIDQMKALGITWYRNKQGKVYRDKSFGHIYYRKAVVVEELEEREFFTESKF